MQETVAVGSLLSTHGSSPSETAMCHRIADLDITNHDRPAISVQTNLERFRPLPPCSVASLQWLLFERQARLLSRHDDSRLIGRTLHRSHRGSHIVIRRIPRSRKRTEGAGATSVVSCPLSGVTASHAAAMRTQNRMRVCAIYLTQQPAAQSSQSPRYSP